ncbi:MAG TPA: M56 family metallopeptidase [Rhizomicrobium sp.]
MTQLFDHLWQSTAFAAAIGLLTLLLRNNGASIRYALWFVASLKFLLPFSLLTAMGGVMASAFAPHTAMPLVFQRMQTAAQPFSAVAPVLTMPATSTPHVTSILLAIWACGIAAVLMVWLMRGLRLRAVVRQAREASLALPVRVKISAARLEPGLVGIWRPVLLLPEGIAGKLTASEMQAVAAHELCHFHRKDNLTAAVHMVVAALFWFYPLVWWLGARLLEERERACDEAVLTSGNDPHIYAQSILKVCRLYLQSPLACAAGVSGANLKNRMETIMENKSAIRLNAAKKLLLGVSAAAVIVAPVLLGLSASAQGAAATPQQVQQALAEQAVPRTAISIDPASFDRFVGYYRMDPNNLFHVSRKGDHYFVGVIGQTPDEMYAESAAKFFLKGLSLPAQFSFTVNAQGLATEMVLHQSGMEQHAPRVDDAQGRLAQADLDRRIAANVQSPGTQAALRHQIDGLISGQPDYSKMVPTLAAGTRQMLPQLHAQAGKWGAVTAVTFTGVSKSGMDTYLVTCRNARVKWDIAPLTPDGRISGIFFGDES